MPYVEYDEVEATCSDCGRMFRSEEALDAHRTEVHQPVERSAIQPKPGPPSNSSERCTNCGMQLASDVELRRHVRSEHRKSNSQTAAL
jgi:DNA-directed RNA polymerase subunit RPC12/RpoP